MDAVEFLKERMRMCNYLSRALEGDFCRNCGLSRHNNSKKVGCDYFIREYPEQAVEIVEGFSEAHPRKTIFDDFREKYPNFMQEIDGTPRACVKYLGYIKACPMSKSCSECWHTPLEEVEE